MKDRPGHSKLTRRFLVGCRLCFLGNYLNVVEVTGRELTKRGDKTLIMLTSKVQKEEFWSVE